MTFVVAAWALCARTTAAGALSQRLGHRTEVGAVYPWMKDGRLVLIVHDVRIMGKTPFDRDVLATSGRVEVTPGTPPRVRIEGLDVTLLAAPNADNVRGTRAPRSRAPAKKLPARSWPNIDVVSGRMTAQVALPGGRRLAVRVPDLKAQSRGRAVHLQLSRAVGDLTGVVTGRLGHVDMEATSEGDVLVEGRGLSVQLPNGHPFLDGLQIDGLYRDGNFSLAVAAPSGQAHSLRAQLSVGRQGVELDVEADRWPLAALAPALDPLGVGTASARGRLALTANLPTGEDALTWRMDVGLSDVTFHHPVLDRQVWPARTLRAEGRGTFDVAEQKLNVEEATLAPLGLPVHIGGWVRLAGTPNGSMSLRTPAGGWPCSSLTGRMPPPLGHHLVGLQMAGQLEAAIDVAFDAAAWHKMALDIRMPSTCTVTQEPRRLADNLESLLKADVGLSDRPELPISPAHRDFTPITKLPTHVLAAFLTAEDAGFFMHNGFEPENIRRALIYNIERGGFVRGASTITQQVAKNLFLSHQRTFGRKAAEAVLSWRLEALVPKRRVLEMYLNLVELGPGIHGVGAAARAYFGKEPGALTPLEAAHLASLPPNPRGFARRFREGSVDEGWLARLYDLVGIMGRRGHLSPAQVTAARASRLRLRKI